MKILALAGSLRSGSLNRALIGAAAELAPDGVVIQEFDLGSLPFYNGDLDRPGAWPDSVLEFSSAVRDADALLIATPEYNHVIPGVLGNALDWASRPLGSVAPLRDKPVAVMGASPGLVGTARAQDHLKFVLMTVGATVLPRLGLLVGGARAKFHEGTLTDQETRARLADFLASFTAFARHSLENSPA